MICELEKGHEGPCQEGTTSGGCRKTASKWFTPQETVEIDVAADAIPEVGGHRKWSEVRRTGDAAREERVAGYREELDEAIGLQVDEDRLVEVWVPVPGGVMAIPGDEWPTIKEQTLVRYYRQTVVPPRERKEAIEWARETLAERDA